MGQSAMVGGKTQDPLLGGDTSAQGTEDGSAGQTSGDTQITDPVEPKTDSQQARDSALSLLQDAASREDADEAVKNQLNDNIQTMANYTVTEAQIENLVVAKGYTDCVAFIGEEALSLAVSAPEGGLTEADTAKILDVVKQAAGFTADQVTIIEVE